MPYLHQFTPPSETSAELVPTGLHDFRVVAAYDTDPDGITLETSEGVRFLKLKCAPENAPGQVTHSLFLEERNARKLNAFLWATGIGKEGQAVDWTPEAFVGATFSGSVVHNSANGRTFAKIVRVQPKKGTTDAQEIPAESAPEKPDELPF